VKPGPSSPSLTTLFGLPLEPAGAQLMLSHALV
jgi:hypothetical protein